MIFYPCPDSNKPIGGIKQAYRSVEVLTRAGYDVRVLHKYRGFQCGWFENDAPLAYAYGPIVHTVVSFLERSRLGWLIPTRYRLKSPLLPSLGQTVWIDQGSGRFEKHKLSDTDVIVLPEFLGLTLQDQDIPSVVFNQNIYNMFRSYGLASDKGIEDKIPAIYSDSNLLGCLVVSDHNNEFMRLGFPDIEIHRIVYSVNNEIFHPRDRKIRQIAYMPRKRQSHLESVLGNLSNRGALKNWTLAPIVGLNEQEVGKVLRESMVFLSGSTEEGFGLPPAEAGMAGCLVVGYTGGGGDEFFDESYSFPVKQDDILDFASRLAEVLRWAEENEEKALERGRAYSRYLTERYSVERERESILEAWGKLVGSLPGSP